MHALFVRPAAVEELHIGECLRQRQHVGVKVACLIVLDNGETILQPRDRTGMAMDGATGLTEAQRTALISLGLAT